MRTITVTGKGNLKVKPDLTRITVTLTGRHHEYDETLEKSAEATEELKETLKPFGFEEKDIKTLSFNVDTAYESERDKNGSCRQKFAGYDFNHVLKAEFDSDNERLGKILYALAHMELKPEFRLSYTVKDPEISKNELLEKAAADAAAKAKVLADAAGVSLKSIQSIDYSWGEIEFESSPMPRMMTCSAGSARDNSYSMDIEPDDIAVSDTVTIIWEIEG